jgi:hypothetical protein
MVLEQGDKVTLRVQLAVPVAFDQLPPLRHTSTAATPLAGEPGSLAVPDTVVGDVVRFAPLAGLEIATVGGVMSMLTVSLTGLEVETFRARS